MDSGPSLLETGVPGLDRALGGGIPAGDLLLVSGPGGAGRTALGLQAFHAVATGRNALYLSTLSEAPPQLLGGNLRPGIRGTRAAGQDGSGRAMSDQLPAMRVVARQLLQQESSGRTSASGLAAATDRIFQRFSGELGMLVGTSGFQALVSRAARRASDLRPSLAGVQVEGGAPPKLVGLGELEEADLAETAADLELLLAEFIGLVARFLGPDLAIRLVRQAWPDLPDEARE